MSNDFMLVLVTYATKQYWPAAEMLMYSALHMGKFDRVVMYTEADIPNLGAYEWKPVAIMKAAEEQCTYGDVLVYCDATMTWQAAFDAGHVESIALFSIGDAAEKGYSNDAYTKPECLDLMGADEGERTAWQVNAAIQAYRINTCAMFFLGKYKYWAGLPQCARSDSRYPLHRHDQSVLTVLSVRYNVKRLPDPTQYGNPDTCTLLHHRRLLKRMKTVVVVTPTTGNNISHLARCIKSVACQNVVCLRHLIVCDGPAAAVKTQFLRKQLFSSRLQWLDIPYITGSNRWNGHRVYGAAPFLAQAAHAEGPAELLAYLDEDNYYQPNHLELLLDKLIDGKLDAVHSLRNIVSQDGTFTLTDPASDQHICRDSCESLGLLALSSPGRYFLADTSTWLMTHHAAVQSARCWDVQARDHTKEEADRALTKFMMSGFNVGVVPCHTLNYTAGSGLLSVKPKFFTDGNQLRQYDFDKPCLYLFHFNRQQTEKFMRSQFDSTRSFLLDEWNQGQCRQLHHHFNVVNGFDLGELLPKGATVLMHMCHPHELPLQMLSQRKDLRRILYTAESPNIRHQEQWQWEFLRAIADDVVTYWEALLSTPVSQELRVHRCKHQCHHIDTSNPHDALQLRTNKGSPGSVGMVLENRPGMEAYELNGVRLQCLDGMRAIWAERLGKQGLDITVHGRGWQDSAHWTVGSTVGKVEDSRHAVDILENYSACLIVENCDADGYVSEKVYDGLLAGCVPIFYNARDTFLPESVYFNLATMSITDVTAEQIAIKQRAVYEQRLQLLESAGAQAYADIIKSIVQPPTPSFPDAKG